MEYERWTIMGENGAATLTGERADLLAALRKQRHFLRYTVRGLTDEQARRRTTVSELTLGGLIKHVTSTEKEWARFVVDGPAESHVDWASIDWSNPPAEVLEHANGFRMLEGETLAGLLDDYAAAGVHNVLALRGDPKDGPRADWTPTEGGFTYARELVALATERASFTVGVAAFPGGHPGAESVEHDTEVLLEKQRAGATFAITDMVFRAADYAELVERAKARSAVFDMVTNGVPVDVGAEA